MKITYENYEWDNNWIEKANETSAKRVLYIGDSISCGTRTELNKISGGEILFDGFATSKSLDNPYYFPSLSLFAKQEHSRNAVIFNNGLHGWHIDEQEYSRLYNEFLDKLINEFSGTLIIPVLSTFLTNQEHRNERVIKRNTIVKELAASKNLPIIDLYTVSEQNGSLKTDDGVHFTEMGYKALANELLCELKKLI